MLGSCVVARAVLVLRSKVIPLRCINRHTLAHCRAPACCTARRELRGAPTPLPKSSCTICHCQLHDVATFQKRSDIIPVRQEAPLGPAQVISATSPSARQGDSLDPEVDQLDPIRQRGFEHAQSKERPLARPSPRPCGRA